MDVKKCFEIQLRDSHNEFLYNTLNVNREISRIHKATKVHVI